MHRGYLYAYAFGGYLCYIIDEHFRYFLVVLVGYQSSRYFRLCHRGYHRLRAFALITSPDTAYVKRWTAAVAFEGRVVYFALYIGDVDSFFVLLFVEGYTSVVFVFFGCHIHHVVVEAGDGDTSVFVDHKGNNLTKFVDGVCHGTAEVSRMQVAVRSGYLYLPICQSTQPRCKRRRSLAYHRSIRDEYDIGFQQLFVVSEELIERWRAYLLFAFEDKLDVTFEFLVFDQIFECF